MKGKLNETKFSIENVRFNEDTESYESDVYGVIFVMPYGGNTLDNISVSSYVSQNYGKEMARIYSEISSERDYEKPDFGDEVFIPCWCAVGLSGEENICCHTIYVDIYDDDHPERELGITLRGVYNQGLPYYILKDVREGDMVEFTMNSRCSIRENGNRDQIKAVNGTIHYHLVANQSETRYSQYGNFEEALERSYNNLAEFIPDKKE